MDKEQARFILRSFRPDGADVNDQDFAAALALALENRELGEWLASERAFDAAFARALGLVDLPASLREDIMACLAGERGDFPHAEDPMDALLVGALASLQPPAALRDELLAGLERTPPDRTLIESHPRSSFWRRAGVPLAAAAGIALAFVFTRHDGLAVARADEQVRSEVVQAGFIRTFESASFDFELKKDDPSVLVRHLRERKLPCPGCLPQGLERAKSIGCRELVIDGKRGSVICFDLGADGVVHLMVFNRDDLLGEFPSLESPRLIQEGSWASAHWEMDRKVFILLGKGEMAKLANLL